jgi:ATP-dependent 26S proteasome regulatory subunit
MNNTDVLPENQIVSSAIIDKYIGESARLIREMFGYARDHQVSLAVSFFFLLQK